jgi:protein PhnA
MHDATACPICTMSDILESGNQFECVTCGHEWAGSTTDPAEAGAIVVKDSNGNALTDGDSVTLIKDLKVKGGGITLKAGTKIKRIRIVDGDHEVDCKVDGMAIMLKAQFLKKA